MPLPTARLLLLLSALTGAIGVMLGAFGAHALRERLQPAELAIWQTGTSYLFWHVLAAFAAARWAQGDGARAARLAATLFLTGIAVFSGTLFALALGAPRGFGAITPLGGLALIGGWLALAWAARAKNPTP